MKKHLDRGGTPVLLTPEVTQFMISPDTLNTHLTVGFSILGVSGNFLIIE
jgi:hypothetical protein